MTDWVVVLPAYAAAVLVIELVTSTFLFALFYVQRSRAILILAAGYLFSGALVAPWVVTFPGIFSSLGIEESIQSAAAFAALKRLGFPLFILAYAVLPDVQLARRLVASWIVVAVVSVLAVIAIACWLVLGDWSSLRLSNAFMRDALTPGLLWRLIPALAIALYLAGIVALAARRRTILDLWLVVVLGTLLIEIIQISYLGAGVRMSLGWWAGRLYGLVSASIVLVVMLAETIAVYARLARATIAERRARQNRLTAMEALSATIAHEVNQPLGSMVTNANAGLRWLANPQPELDEAKAAMHRIVEEGHRANKVVSGIRTMFMKGTRERTPLDLNLLIEQVVKQSAVAARLGHGAVTLDLDCQAPFVIGNAIQLQQVVANLIDNAIEAMRAVPARQRRLRIATTGREHGEVVVSIEDEGPGLDPATLDRIFEPFFTTKPDGMGMGLMFCRSAIEAHGGRLWTSTNEPKGAVFSFSLPTSPQPDPAPEENE
ncbi:hypothetical protein ASE66_23465 [Bosea sp. Root483D1]|nr:hypothetical protein ASE66_23465 [Bosea sp. Root483D1]